MSGEKEGQHRTSDLDEWRQWIANKAVELVPEEIEKTIPAEKIITAPMRFVRTNKGKDSSSLEAKSRLVIPGHTDPQLGLYRTDAPTTSHLAVIVCAILSMSLGWGIEIFDVTTAFLSGMAMTRELYTKAPAEGLPAAGRWPRVRPYALLRVLKAD